jgi:imidazolonepropionase
VPAEGRRSDEARRAYVDSIVETMIPAVVEGRKARFCDVFIEQGAFTVDEGRRILEAARKAGLALQVHADQLSHTGATALAAELGATCAAHLEHATDEDLATLAAAGTVAVLLPGASFFLRDTPADGRRMREAGLDVAVGSDFNPGSSPTANLLLAAQMAVLHSGLTLPEALLAITANAARALDLHKDRGRVRAGLRADLAMFRCRDYRELFYEFGTSPCTGVVKDGEYHRVEAARTDRVRLQI